MKKQLLGVLAASLLASPVLAQDAYFGADFSFISAELEIDGISQTFDADPTALRFRAGVNFNENFALEGVIGLGLQDDELSRLGGDLELDSLYGVYAVGTIPLDRTFALFAKAGYVVLEYEINGLGSDDDSGLSAGIGARINVNRNAALVLEYTLLPDIDDAGGSLESDMISLGAQFSF